MRFAVGADHAGFPLKASIVAELRRLGHDVVDKGTFDESPVDYPDFAEAVACSIVAGEAERGIVVCGSGVGAAVAASKVPGIRASVCHDTYSAHQGVAPSDMFEYIAIDDIRAAADLLRPVYDSSDGGDGYVSIEVSPDKAFQTQPTIDEAKRWWSKIDRPNLLIKIPATAEGIPAIEECIADGVNINITLIFAISFYEQVMEAYIRGLERRVAAGQDVRRIHSVASFFVSRVDTATDKRIEAKLAGASESDAARLRGLQGKAAVANAKIAYERFLAVFKSPRFKALEEKGARLQRPLWASTGTKNKAYSDILYVQELIGPDTVNTLPPATIDAFRDHGIVRRTIDEGIDEAHAVMRDLAAANISIDEVTDELQREGVAAFSKSFEQIAETTASKAGALKSQAGAA